MDGVLTQSHAEDDNTSENLSGNRRRATLEEAEGQPLYPQLILLDAAVADGYLRDWQPTGLSYERHLGYAVQWYALAATLAVLYVVVGLRKRGVLK